MDFFELPPPSPPPERAERFVPPEWMAPRHAVLPGYSPQQAVIFRTDRVALVAHRFLVYPKGVVFSVSLWNNEPDAEVVDDPWELHQSMRTAGWVLPDGFLRFGVLLDDGSKWTNVQNQEFSHEHMPAKPFITGRGGGGGGSYWEYDFWMWPLPTGDSLTFVAEWPIYAIPNSRASVDASEIRSRAADSKSLWPE